MSLRKSTCLTPRRLDAARQNAQHSTGPRSEAGKLRMRMNALKHGCDAAPQNDAAVMRALGEDPEQFDALKRELSTTYGPGEALWDQQIDDLARLYWRRQRLDRIETGLMRRALQAVEERQRLRAKALTAATFDLSQFDAVGLDLGLPLDPCVRRRQLLSLLGVIREQVKQRNFQLRQKRQIETYYRGEVGWRPVQIGHLLGLFIERAEAERKYDAEEFQEFLRDNFPGGQAQMEAQYQELLRLLEEEITDVEEDFQHQVAVQEEKAAIERDACLAPAGETWEMLLRQEATLDRSLDRKVRILMAMRKEYDRLGRGGSRTAPTQQEEGPPDNESNDREAQELSKLVGLDGTEVAPNFSSAGADLKVSATNHGTESPAEEDAGETSKSPEQSENVSENKGPAANGANLPLSRSAA